MAKGIRYNIGLKTLKRTTRSKSTNRRFSAFEEVQNVLLAWDEAQLDADRQIIDTHIQFWEKQGKQVFKVIYFHKRKKENIPTAPDEHTLHLSKLDFNAFGMPKTMHVKKLMSQSFDYFINLNLDGRLPLKSLAGFTKSACRIGFHSAKAMEFYDMILGNPENPDIGLYTKDLEFYLQKMG